MATAVENTTERGSAGLPADLQRVTPAMKKKQRQDLGWALVFLSPQLVGLIVFMLGPLVFAVILGFSNWDGFGSRTFVGFDNFVGVLQDQQLRQSWINTAWFTVLQLPGLMITGFIFAFLLQKNFEFRSEPKFHEALGSSLTILI